MSVSQSGTNVRLPLPEKKTVVFDLSNKNPIKWKGMF